MTERLPALVQTLMATVNDVAPIVLILAFFQLAVLRRPLPNPGRALLGFLLVLVGLVLFLEGLELSLFPLGKLMARQLTDPAFIGAAGAVSGRWEDYLWVYVFAAAIGFSTTLAEPALIAVAMQAHQVSGGAISIWGLRVAVALGVAVGVALGTYRIISGTPLYHYIIAGYVVVIVQTAFAQRMIVPLAYDSGGVTTSTVTVPLVTALGMGLAGTLPGRSVLIDGFGLIAFASLFPIVTVLGYAQLSALVGRRNSRKKKV
ncbi:MAG TPA: DUF1538 domain-containing protein [Gammaproteobacteria bacterium]|nr:DUF1538 domain-containing protein [Gammaproteobacteria bacterium]